MTNGSIKKSAAATLMCALLGACASSAWTDMSGAFTGWRQVGDANWRIENGEFVADSGAGHLVTEESYTDFSITTEFWASEGANSGIFFRISDPNAITDTSAYEANIFDTRPDQTYRTGGLVNFAAPAEVINTPGQWNSYEITVTGDRIVMELNGIEMVDTRDSTHASGPISLQYGAGTVKFRNVKIRRL